MIRLKDLSLQATAGLSMSCFVAMAKKYNPLINYDWSITTTSGLRYLKDIGSAPTYNASMYFGRGAYFNGVDQSITVPINTTIQTALKRVNGVVTINEASQTLTNYVISGLGVHKDYYLFTRLLTTAEKDSYTNTPELFYAMAQADSTCVLNMPMCETDGFARNMKTYSKTELMTNTNNFYIEDSAKGTIDTSNNEVKVISTALYDARAKYNIASSKLVQVSFEAEIYAHSGSNGLNVGDTMNVLSQILTAGVCQVSYTFTSAVAYIRIGWHGGTEEVGDYFILRNISIKQLTGTYAIANYTLSVRDNAKNLQYGLQTCKFVRDSLGVIQSASNYLEFSGVGKAIIPSHSETVNIKMTVNPTSLSGNLLSGGVTKTLTGLTLNIDNDVVISNVTPTGAITLASGFTGTIKSYIEETR